jgi:hypothetical protein
MRVDIDVSDIWTGRPGFCFAHPGYELSSMASSVIYAKTSSMEKNVIYAKQRHV